MKRSKTWEFFSDLGDNKATCTLCYKTLYHNGPFNLTRHLRNSHPSALNYEAKVTANKIKKNPRSSPEVYYTETSLSKCDLPKKVECNVKDFFTNLGEKKAKCNICLKVLSYKGAGPYNLKRHLNTAHTYIVDYDQDEEQQATDIESKTSIFLDDTYETLPSTSNDEELEVENSSGDKESIEVFYVGKNKSDKKTSKKELSNHRTINKSLLTMLIKNYIPFSFIESDSFNNFIHALNPSYTIPNKKTLSNSLLLKYYQSVKEKVQKALTEAEFVSLSTEFWTSNVEGFCMAITAHYIDNETKINSYMLKYVKDIEGYTPENYAQLLEKICEEWNIFNKVVAVTTDTSETSPIKAAIDLLGWRQIQCFSSTLNLIVQSALTEIDVVLAKVKSVIEVLYRNTATNGETNDITRLYHKYFAINQNSCSWISIYNLYKYILEIKDNINSVLTNQYPNAMNFTTEDFEIISKCCEMICHFKSVTEIMSAEKHVTISQIIVLIHLLKNKCEAYIGMSNQIPQVVYNMVLRLNTELTTRFNNIEDNELYAVSTLLDPRFKTFGFPENKKSSVDRAKHYLSNLAANSAIPSNYFEQHETEDPLNDEIENGNERCSIWGDFDVKVGNVLKSQNQSDAALIEVDKYFVEPLLNRKSNSPLLWWNAKKQVYPRLYSVVKKQLCIPATSIPPEYLFTKTGQSLNEKRHQLHGNKAQMIMFLNGNM